jgi:hypothetical protein
MLWVGVHQERGYLFVVQAVPVAPRSERIKGHTHTRFTTHLTHSHPVGAPCCSPRVAHLLLPGNTRCGPCHKSVVVFALSRVASARSHVFVTSGHVHGAATSCSEPPCAVCPYVCACCAKPAHNATQLGSLPCYFQCVCAGTCGKACVNSWSCSVLVSVGLVSVALLCVVWWFVESVHACCLHGRSCRRWQQPNASLGWRGCEAHALAWCMWLAACMGLTLLSCLHVDCTIFV